MFNPHLSKPIISLSTDKSNRQFGKDITNSYNSQANILHKQTIADCFSFVVPEKQTTFLQRRFRQNSVFEIELDTAISYKNPLDDHIDDIMSYTLDQSFISFIQEDYMPWHSEINESMREILVNWLIRIQIEFKLRHSTLCLAVHLIDKFCYQQTIQRNKYQLLGATCMFMASKYEELATPRMEKFVSICQGLYTNRQMILMEGEILESVSYNMNKIVLLRQLLFNRVDEVFRAKKGSFINMEDEYDGYCLEMKFVLLRCQYFLEMILIEYKFNLMQPHYLSAVLLYMACKMEKIQFVNSKFVVDKYNLCEKMFKQCFQQAIELVRKKNNQKFREINRKYQHLNYIDF